MDQTESFYAEHLSDYSEDFEDDDSSRGAGARKQSVPLLQHLDTTPQHASLKHTRGARTDPVPRKAKSHYNPALSKPKNWRKGKGRAFSERDIVRKQPRGTPFSPRDRELSAKLHSIKMLQNRLADCQRELGDSKKENKLLTRLQVRQERELNRVSTQEGELPQILARHAEEVRVLKEQLKRSNESNLSYQEKVHTLQTELQRLNDRRKKLEQVSKRKNLLEREALTLQLQDANDKIQNKERKLKEVEKGMEALHKTHGQEVKSLMHKNKVLLQEAEAAKEKADKAQAQLKERTKEMDVMNIYSQRIGKNTLNTSLRLHVPLTEDNYSQTDLSCAPNKNVSMQTKAPLKSSSSQTQAGPSKSLQTRTTQTNIESNVHQSSHRQTQATSPPPQQQPSLKSSPVHQAMLTEPNDKRESPKPPTPAPEPDEEQQKKNLLLSRLRALDSQKGPPASQPVPSVALKSTIDVTASAAVSVPAKHPAAVIQPKVQNEEAKKKKLLLAKLMAIDDKNDPNDVTISKLNVTDPAAADNGASLTPKSSRSNTSLQSRPEMIENMHKGKPAYFTDDDPFGSRNASAKRLSGLLKSKSGTNENKPTLTTMATSAQEPTTVNSNSQSYKPTFGRRACDTNVSTGPIKTLFNGGIESNSRATTKETATTDNGFSSRQTGGKRDYPWERRIKLDNNHGPSNPLEGPGNQSMVFGPMSNNKGPLLPLRQKAEVNRVDMMPGTVAEPDDLDLEELVL